MSEANIEGNAGSASPAEPRHLRRALIIWAVLSVIGIAVWLALAQFILPAAASGLDSSDNFTFLVLTVLAVPVSLFPSESKTGPRRMVSPYSPHQRCRSGG